jgi:hypothetical protein
MFKIIHDIAASLFTNPPVVDPRAVEIDPKNGEHLVKRAICVVVFKEYEPGPIIMPNPQILTNSGLM